ncbi:MAG TPA: ATP-binding protein [Longimicrobiales bacterium]
MQDIFLPSLLVVAGVSLFAGLIHLASWTRGAPDARTHGWFGFVALLVACYTIASWRGYVAPDIATLIEARRAALGFALIALPAFVFFTIRYAHWQPRRAGLLVWPVPLGLAALNLVLPWSIGFRSQPVLRHTTLFDGTVVSSAIGLPTYAATTIWLPVYAFVLASAWRLAQRGDRERATPLALGTLLMIGAGVNDVLVQTGVTQVYLSEFAFLGLVGLMSVRLSHELVRGATLERALTRSEQQLRLTLDAIADSVIVVDAYDRVVLMNPAAVRLTGLPTAEAVGRGLEDVLRRTSGRELAASRAPITEERGGAVVVLRDVTQERELERLTRETRTMRAIGETAGSIAHEYKNLLGIVLGHAELLDETLPPLDRETRESIRAIEGAARRALDLSRRALLLSPARATPLTVVVMHDVVRAAVRLLGDTLGDDIRIDVDLHAAIDTVAGDPEELNSALVNLAMNARDAMPDGGRLTFASELETITGDEVVARAFDLVPGTFFRLSVSDTGTGIPEAVRGRIFEPWFTTKPRGLGTGLGLAAVYSAVTEPGGAITVRSETGAGTTFTILLPIIEPIEA